MSQQLKSSVHAPNLLIDDFFGVPTHTEKVIIPHFGLVILRLLRIRSILKPE